MLFVSSYQLFSFLRYLKLRPDFFGHVGKRLGKKAEINSKIYDVTNWKTNNCNSWFPCLIFCMIFKQKYFSCYALLTNFNYSNFIVWLLFFHKILGHICIIIICFSVCDVINFEIKLSYQVFFLYDQKSLNKYLNIFRTKRVFEMRWKVFFIIFKGFSVAKDCLRPESGPLK